VAIVVADGAHIPSACSNKKDRRGAKRVTKAMRTARKNLEKAATTPKVRTRARQLRKAEAMLRRATALADESVSRLSPTCRGAIAEQVIDARAQAACLH
jgi:hypothetical protein